MADLPRPGSQHGSGGRQKTQHAAAEPALLIVSLLLCAWMDVRALALVLLIATTDFWTATRLAATDRPRTRRLLLATSLTLDIGLLLLWRAAGAFSGFAGSLDTVLPPTSLSASLIVPVGLSFFTLRSLGFVIDVYRGAAAPCTAWTRYAAFLCFFPAFVAGPISRGSQLLPQLQSGISLSWTSLVEGTSILVQGLAKKMLIADRLATIVDPVFAHPELYPPWTMAAGILAYSLQIYADFAGYSDMAIGAARIVGIDLPRNFDMPYLATNIAEFWHRWHITLSTWLRDYVFLPLAYAGSRWVDDIGLPRRQGELLNHAAASILTMLLAGLWHGSGWGFVLWGGAHGIALTTHRVWQVSGRRKRRLSPWLGRALTFVFISLAWVPFRAGNLGEAANVYQSLIGLGTQRTYQWFPSWLPICGAAIVIGHLVTLWFSSPARAAGQTTPRRLLTIVGMSITDRPFAGAYLVPTRVTVLGTYAIVILLASILLFAPPKVGPFVYAAF